MSSRWLREDMEQRIVDGSWLQLIGLLEDIYRCVDGMSPKGERVRGLELPYFGKYVGGEHDKIERMKRHQSGQANES